MKKLILLVSFMSIAGALAASAAEPKEIWATACARCHGADGKGQTNIGRLLGAKDYTDPAVQAAVTDDAAIKATKEGFSKDGKVVMKPNTTLSDADIKAVVGYMRTFKK
jgi:cytochrome c553